MARSRPDNPSTAWSDILDTIPHWQAEHGVIVQVVLQVEPALSTGAYAEVVLFEATTGGKGAELVRVREPFPMRRSSGQAGAVLHAVFRALAELEGNPWLWPTRKRRAVVSQG